MPLALANDVELFYDTAGDPSGPPILLIAGLGTQLINWPDYFIDPLIAAGFCVVSFDNRDIGLSTKFEGWPDNPQVVFDAVANGEDPGLGYTLSDMAADAVGLLDALGIDKAHVVGVSMGAMIAQIMAIGFGDRVLSLTSIMGSTGSVDNGQPTEAALEAILSAAPSSDREAVIAKNIEAAQVWASPEHRDPDRLRALFNAAWDRAGGPQSTNAARQFCAIVASPDRNDQLCLVTAPSLVVHGRQDTLISVSGGERTAELLPNADFLVVDGMGHDLVPAFAPGIAGAIVDLVKGASSHKAAERNEAVVRGKHSD